MRLPWRPPRPDRRRQEEGGDDSVTLRGKRPDSPGDDGRMVRHSDYQMTIPHRHHHAGTTARTVLCLGGQVKSSSESMGRADGRWPDRSAQSAYKRPNSRRDAQPIDFPACDGRLSSLQAPGYGPRRASITEGGGRLHCNIGCAPLWTGVIRLPVLVPPINSRSQPSGPLRPILQWYGTPY